MNQQRPSGYDRWPPHVRGLFDLGMRPPHFETWPPIIQQLFDEGEIEALRGMARPTLNASLEHAAFLAWINMLAPAETLAVINTALTKMGAQLPPLDPMDQQTLEAIPIALEKLLNSPCTPQTVWAISELSKFWGQLLMRRCAPQSQPQKTGVN